MDLTLNQIVERVNNIHSQMDKLNMETHYSQIQQYKSELQSLERNLSAIYMKVSNILGICSNQSNIIKLERQEKLNKCTTKKSTDKNTTVKNIANNISMKVKTVNHIDEIPSTPIYWIEDINQFVLNINGVILRGNMGNIYNQNHIKKNNDNSQTVICKNGNKCKNLTNTQKKSENGSKKDKLCKFYHDPLDLLELLNSNKITMTTFQKYKTQTRNFINTSWVYTDLQYNKKNLMMRHFGSNNTLKHELDLMKIDNSDINETMVKNYKQQTIHDILVLMGLKQCKILKEYINEKYPNEFFDRANTFSILGYKK